MVEPRLSDCDGSVVREQVAQLIKPPGIGRVGIVRMDAERGVHAGLLLGKPERHPARLDARAHSDDARDSGRTCSLEDRWGWLGAGVEMRVRVDQTPAARSTRGKSGGAGSMPLAGASPPERTPSHATSVLWPSALRIARDVAGRYAWSAIATERTPSARS